MLLGRMMLKVASPLATSSLLENSMEIRLLCLHLKLAAHSGGSWQNPLCVSAQECMPGGSDVDQNLRTTAL